MPLEQLGPYRIEQMLGRGGMGTVYVGVHEETGQRVAVKALLESLADDARFRDRFEIEVDTLKQLSHPNIVSLIGYGEQDGMLFYSMDLIEGANLHDELSAGRRFDWREVAQFGVQICHALKHAHDCGVIHRDLKPANLILDENGQIKLADFGIAKLFGATQMTAVGGVVGTADYMSPEQAQGEPVTAKSDLYSLGCVFFTLLVGRPPFSAKTVAQVLHKMRYDDPPSVRHYAIDTPEEFERIINELLEKDPAKRIATPRVLANRLQAMIHALSVREPDESEELGQTIDSEPSQLPGTEADVRSDLTVSPPAETQAFDSELDYELAADVATVDAPTAEKEPTPTSTTRRFTSVDADSRRRQASATAVEEAPAWIKPLAAVGLIAIVMAMSIWLWFAVRGPSQEELYQQIQAVAENADAAELLQVESEIDLFLQNYPEDDRSEELRELAKDIQGHRLFRRLERKARLKGGSDFLPPAEQAYLDAMRLMPSNQALGIEKLKFLVDVFQQYDDDSRSTAECVEMAVHQLRRSDTGDGKVADHGDALRSLLSWAEEKYDGDDLRRFRRGIIGLYGDKLWASEIVESCRKAIEDSE